MDANLIVQMIRSGAFNPGNVIARGFQPQRDLASVIRRDAVPVAETEEDVQRMEGTYRAPPAIAAPETGVRPLERQMWPDFFNPNGTVREQPYPMADAMADHPSSSPAEKPLAFSVRAGTRRPPQAAPGRRPPSHTAPASPGLPQAAPAPRQQFDGGDGWIPPDQGAAQNQALLQASAGGEAGPQFQAGAAANLAGLNPNVQTSYASGSGNPPPGSGLHAFLNSGAMPRFKQADVGPSDWQGPVLPHENTGKQVGVVEGSMADKAPALASILSLFGGGGGF